MASFKLLSSTGWVIDTETFYTDFSASMTPDGRSTVFQYFNHGAPVLFECDSSECSKLATISMPGLLSAEFALGGVSPRRIQQYSPIVFGAKFFFSVGHAAPNRNVELVTCESNDNMCAVPFIQNTADSFGFGTAGLRLIFNRKGMPMVLIPEARYASVDNRVTGYIVQSCQDPLCRGSRLSYARLPFNLTGKASCEATSIDVALNRFGFPTWLTQCGPELNLIHCLTESCNETSVAEFVVNTIFVYFVYLAVDSQYRFSISTSGQVVGSDITYIRCVDPDCTKSNQYQLSIPCVTPSLSTKVSSVYVQHVIDPQTNFPVFHFPGSTYPSRKPYYVFIACEALDCSEMSNIIDYGILLELDEFRVGELFVDSQGIISSVSRVKRRNTNETINLVVRIGRNDSNFDPSIRWIQI